MNLAADSVLEQIIMSRMGVTRFAPYILVGAFLCGCVLKSGVHATLAGEALGASARLGVMIGSLASSVFGHLFLRASLKRRVITPG
jgi:Na+/H+ antiporter NhaA